MGTCLGKKLKQSSADGAQKMRAPTSTRSSPSADLRGDNKITFPSLSGAPSIKTSDEKPAMLRGGKLQMQTTRVPTSYASE
jgi:hypothetical protein